MKISYWANLEIIKYPLTLLQSHQIQHDNTWGLTLYQS